MEIDQQNYLDFEVMKKLYNLKVMTALDGSFVIYDDSFENLKQINSHVDFEVTRHNMDELLEGEGALIDAFVIREYEDLSKIITSNGRTGYVKTNKINPKFLEISEKSLNEVREDFRPEEPFHITWNQVSSYKNNPNVENQDAMTGVSILSPTWFSLNINGIVINESDFRYMRQAHESGYYVWGLFSNSFNPSWTSDMLNEAVYRKRAIAQILFYAALYDLDGVNIDYENMFLDDKDAFTRFIAELSPLLQSQNVVLSIDVTVPGGSDQYSLVLDRYNLGKHVDYMMLMAYDEHWGSSPISGPVASIPWVEKGLTRTLEEVPSQKVLLGIPLYMRVWIESNGSVTSKAIGIRHLEGVLENQDYEASYDEENGVNYISYESEGKLYRIWVEDEVSLQKRIDFVKRYNLAGIATWSKEFADEKTWSFIYDALRD
jgi:spore germination protein YaaH